MTPGPFKIFEIRASGSYAAVCLAQRTNDPLGRHVALKVLRATLIDNPQVLTRTRDEARVLSKLNHPNILKVEQLLGIQRRPVMVMEWIDGLSAREILTFSPKGLPVAVALEIASRTSSALSAAYGARDDNGHPLRILHRDIKPGNLLLSTHGQVKVIDFGLSRGDYYERETSTISTLVGSLGYMAPERFMGSQKASPSIDVYSVGITLAELLCGRPPVLPRSPDAHPDALRRYLTYVAPDLSSSCRDPLITLLSEMCSADPSARPSHEETQRRLREIQVAGEMSTDLTAFVSRVVKPRDRDRPRVEPKAHPAWEDIQFLEDPNAPLPNRLVSDPSPGPVSDTQTNDRVREFLNSAQWETRKRELKWLLAVHPNWSSEPFLEVLQRGTQPWWRFWSRSASESEMALALEVLKHRLSPRLLDMARGLTDHPNARVATAASVLIERYKGEH